MRSTLFAIALLCVVSVQAEETVFPFAQVADNGTGQQPEPPLMPVVQHPNQTVPPTQEANPQTPPGPQATATIPGQTAQLPIPAQTQQVQPNSAEGRQAQVPGQTRQAQPAPQRAIAPAQPVYRNAYGQEVSAPPSKESDPAYSAKGKSQSKRDRLWAMVAAASEKQEGPDKSGVHDGEGTRIKAKPGRTYSVTIAKNALNRITTPFDEPKTLTTDPIEASVEGSSVYVATSSETPVSLFIQDGDSKDAVSLRLVPVDAIGPVEIGVEMDRDSVPGGKPPNSRPGSADHPYIDELKSVMRSLALGKIPQGYNLDASPHQESRAELCAQPDIVFGLGQKLNGTAVTILVMKAENKGASPRLLDETACVSQDVLAVAAWPKIRLEPHEKTEVYVAVRMDDPMSTEENRPSLIDR